MTDPAIPTDAAAQGAIAEAAFMTGLERNSDAVAMAAYAPLFVNDARGFRAWPTNLIVFDSTRCPARPPFTLSFAISNISVPLQTYVVTMKGRNADDEDDKSHSNVR